jgi:hypothetical protein
MPLAYHGFGAIFRTADCGDYPQLLEKEKLCPDVVK